MPFEVTHSGRSTYFWRFITAVFICSTAITKTHFFPHFCDLPIYTTTILEIPATSTGTMLSRAGGLYPGEECDHFVFECHRHCLITIRASFRVQKTSPLSSSFPKWALKLSQYPFPQCDPSSMQAGFALTLAQCQIASRLPKLTQSVILYRHFLILCLLKEYSTFKSTTDPI